MAILSRFDTPGRLDELSEDHRLAWSRKVAGMIDQFTDGQFPQFYNPTVEDTPAGVTPAPSASKSRAASLMRSFNDCAVKPPNTTEWAAPMRAHASIATGSSGTIPR